MVNRKRAKHLKIGVTVGVLCLNASVFCIWIPAKLGVNETYEKLNVVWGTYGEVQIAQSRAIRWLFDCRLHLSHPYIRNMLTVPSIALRRSSYLLSTQV